ncbi:hypothetical protein, partial [Akkermansia sp.]|uniref:hypothetical protein n=1 Tax=Akkermansia sp. TaxID=1872421 RepID=UPI003AB24052
FHFPSLVNSGYAVSLGENRKRTFSLKQTLAVIFLPHPPHFHTFCPILPSLPGPEMAWEPHFREGIAVIAGEWGMI